MIKIKGQPTKRNGGVAWTALGSLSVKDSSMWWVSHYLLPVCAYICLERAKEGRERYRIVAVVDNGIDPEEVIVDIDSFGAELILRSR